jgi:hypothetical protein
MHEEEAYEYAQGGQFANEKYQQGGLSGSMFVMNDQYFIFGMATGVSETNGSLVYEVYSLEDSQPYNVISEVRFNEFIEEGALTRLPIVNKAFDAKTNRPTNHEVWRNGSRVQTWDSNEGGNNEYVDQIIRYKGENYLLTVNLVKEMPLRADEPALIYDIPRDGNTYAKGGGVRKDLFSNREWSYGRNWTNDHRHQNRSEDYEVPQDMRKYQKNKK